jgi:hypothetical protein
LLHKQNKIQKYTGTESALPKARAFSLSLSLSLSFHVILSFSPAQEQEKYRHLILSSLHLSFSKLA